MINVKLSEEETQRLLDDARKEIEKLKVYITEVEREFKSNSQGLQNLQCLKCNQVNSDILDKLNLMNEDFVDQISNLQIKNESYEKVNFLFFDLFLLSTVCLILRS